MTVLDTFIAFTRGLPADRRMAVDDALAAIMASFEDGNAFTPAETAELRRRDVEADPELSGSADIEQLFGRPFRA